MKNLIQGVLSSFLTGRGGTQAALINAVISAMTQQGGGAAQGLSQMVSNFEKNGLGDIAKTWVGTGQNAQVNAEQIQQGLGMNMVQQIAQSAGLKPEQASSMLAQLLPNLVDQLTPNGAIDNQAVGNLIQSVVKKMAA
jgi:uncharacterized protein YidB (DUF937 family)